MAHRNRFAAATALAAALSLSATPSLAHGYHHWHGGHHDHVDAGGVVTGVAIIGALAAIASIASNSHHQDRAAVAQPVPDDRQGYADGSQNDSSLDRLADSCVGAVERGQDRVDYVDNVARDGSTWVVTGAFQNGAGFSCRVGNDGQVQGVNVAGPRSDGAPQGAPALNNDSAPAIDNRPVWHDPAENAAPPTRDDGRYTTSQAPDFTQGV